MKSSWAPVHVFHSRQEADMAAGLLRNNGLTPEVRGSKEYSSHITGIETGRFELLLPNPDELKQAEELLAEVLKPESPPPAESQGTARKKSLDPNKELKNAAWLMFMSLMLPLAANAISLFFLRRYYKSSPQAPRRYLWMALILLGNLAMLGLFAATYFRD